MPTPERSHIAIAPEGAREWLGDAITASGATLVAPGTASGVVWTRTRHPEALDELLGANPAISWVQLPFAGVEPYVEVIRRHPHVQWTCGKGVYADPVAEHALALALAGLRHLGGYARARTWTDPAGTNLLGARVLALGGGGITRALLRLLEPFGARTTVVRRTPEPVAGAAAVAGMDQLDELLPGADLVVLALALTEATRGVFDRTRLERMAPHAWLVNVARGAHVVTDDLVAVLAAGAIGGAALDVTDPEPLPDDHPLWREPRCILTPHTANTPEMAVPLLSARVAENVRRWIAGDPLLGPVDPVAGY